MRERELLYFKQKRKATRTIGYSLIFNNMQCVSTLKIKGLDGERREKICITLTFTLIHFFGGVPFFNICIPSSIRYAIDSINSNSL